MKSPGTTTPSCAHANCGCPPAPAEAPYCSAYCANAARDEPPEGACACDHAHCTASQQVAHEQGEVQTGVGPDPEPDPSR